MGRLIVGNDQALLRQFNTITSRLASLKAIRSLSEFQQHEQTNLENNLAKVKMKMLLKGIQVPE